MKYLLSAMIAAGSLGLATAALAQAPTSMPAPAAQDNQAPAAGGKRSACQTAAQGMKGQERQDQMQLCMAQAHLDCLKQAIDQKIVGAQRRDFMKTCMGGR
jgi:hypothetical protein